MPETQTNGTSEDSDYFITKRLAGEDHQPHGATLQVK